MRCDVSTATESLLLTALLWSAEIDAVGATLAGVVLAATLLARIAEGVDVREASGVCAGVAGGLKLAVDTLE